MNISAERHVRVGDTLWTVRDPSADWTAALVTPYLDRPADLPGARLMKHNMVRTLVSASPPAAPLDVVIKVHRCVGLFERLRHVFMPSKAAREWTMAPALAGAGVPTCAPVAYAEQRRAGLLRTCCFISETLRETESLKDLLAGPMKAWPAEDRQRVLAGLAALLGRMHGARIAHNDFHAWNVLCRRRAQGLELHVLDLHSAREYGRLDWADRQRDLVSLLASIQDLTSPDERDEFLRLYVQGDEGLERLLEEHRPAVEEAVEALLLRARRRRTRRCLKRSSEFDIQTIDGARVYFRRDFPPALIRQTLALHREAVAAGGERLLQRSPRGCVTSVQVEGRNLLVKESGPYRWRKRIAAVFGRSESLRIWLSSHGLGLRGVPACEMLAAGEHRRCGLVARSFVIMRAVENGVPLDRYAQPRLTCVQGGEQVRFRRSFARCVGGFLGQLHEKRIYHADLKPANVLVRERGDQDWEFILVDLDRVRFDRALTLKQRARNLAQLDSPFQFHLPRTDRLRAFRAYLEACPAEDERLLLRESLRETEKRRRNDQEIIQEQLERLNSGKTDFPRKL